MVSNEEKSIYRRQQADKVKQPVILEQTIYDTKKPMPSVPPQRAPPEYVPVPNPYYPMINPNFAYGYKPNQVILGMIQDQDFETAKNVIQQIYKKYPDFGGVYMWQYFDAPPNILLNDDIIQEMK